jgi:fibro-slime domain-containing protein
MMEDCDATLEMIVRDFHEDHPDMQANNGGWADIGCGMVQPELFVGTDGSRSPLFQAGNGTGKRNVVDGVIACNPWDAVSNPQPEFEEISGEMSFNQWYSDVENVNSTFEHTLLLKPLPSNENVYYYDSAEEPGGKFFPANGKGFDEVTGDGNYHFTTEAHVRFIYNLGDKFSFSGDDDMWIFVNDKLALDLGGLHGPLDATIDFDAQADDLGIEPGKTYNMDIFHAERHTSDSNYRVETSIGCFEMVDVPRVVVK